MDKFLGTRCRVERSRFAETERGASLMWRQGVLLLWWDDALLARVGLDRLLAQLALDAAAPMELAAASLGHAPPRRREAPPAAHQLAAVGPRRLTAAAAAARARRPGGRVRVAEAARRLDEDEVVAGGPVEGAVALDEPRALPVELDLGGGVVAVEETVAGLAERRQLVPAGAHAAGSRHAVALAAHLGVPVHRLPAHNTPAHAQHTSIFQADSKRTAVFGQYFFK